MVQPRAEIPITEVWSRNTWANFDTYQAATNATTMGRNGDGITYPFGLSTQNHIDVRTFTESQGWTGGLVTGPLSAHNHWPGATATVTPGAFTYVSNYTKPIDFTAIGSGNLIMALPSLPRANINTAQSSVALSSDGFNNHICILLWSASTTPLVVGDSVLTFPYSSLTNIDLTHVTGVAVHITATAGCSISMSGLRLIGPNWVQSNVDFDSLNGQLRQCIPVNGSISSIAVPPNQILPQLWRSAPIAGVDDPRPIDGEVSYLFNTGSQTQTNSFSLYMREVTEAFITQLDLQGTPQASLSGRPQPTLGISEKAPRTMGDLDLLDMADLDDQTMTNVEAVNNPTFTSWIRFTIAWGVSPYIQVSNSIAPSNGYKYSSGFTFANNTTYLAICNLTGTTARLQVYNVDQTTLAIGTPVFDTTQIPDTFLFQRRGGRIGFQATIQDGDSYVGPVRPRSLTFAEYRSTTLNSLTPVKGARLYVRNSPNTTLFTGWSALSDGTNTPTLTSDQQRYIATDPNHASTKITVTQPSTAAPTQGVISNVLSPPGDAISGITDFDQLHLSFSIWVPGAALNAPTLSNRPLITGALISDTGNAIPINIPSLVSNQWQDIEILRPIPGNPYPRSGLYQLALYYNGTVPATWWLDAVDLHEHSIEWDGRSVADDPWHSNFAPWTLFHTTVNSDTSGILFTTMGTQLQMRALARKQSAAILSAPNLVPIYAELGQFAWPEDALVPAGQPNALISSTNVGRAYTFSGVSSTSPNGGVLNYQWTFGDGTASSGPVVQHTYPSWIPSGTAYFVELTAIDRAGLRALGTTIVTL